MASCRALNASVNLMLCPIKWKYEYSCTILVWLIHELNVCSVAVVVSSSISAFCKAARIEWNSAKIKSTLRKSSQAEIRPARRITRIKPTEQKKKQSKRAKHCATTKSAEDTNNNNNNKRRGTHKKN